MKKKKKKGLIIALCILIPIVLVLGTAIGVTLPLLLKYNKYAYEDRPIVERSHSYVRPEMDPQPEEYANITLSEDDLGKDITMTVVNENGEAETIPNNVNPGGTANNYDKRASFGRSSNAISVYGKTPIYKVEKKDPNVENILILGTDSRDVTKERGRSDSIIILSYNKKTGSIKLTSILRDSLVPIEGHNWNRINAAYSFDGVGLAVNTINEVFDLDIQRFVVIDFNGVKDFINKIGGVDISLTEAEVNYFKKHTDQGLSKAVVGMNHLNGSQTLSYMRLRKLDSDFKRTERQRKVIVTVAQKIINEKSIDEIYALTEDAFKLVRTNISFTELVSTIVSVASNSKKLNIESQHVPYSDAFVYKYYNGMAIVSFDVDAAAVRINKFIYG